MKVLSIKVDDRLHRRLRSRAASANLSLSQLLHPLLEEAASPGGRYVFTGQDEILGVAIQIFALVTELAAERGHALVERASIEARAAMRERGLLPSGIIPVSGELDDEDDLPGRVS
ncbi:hypothetical protein [Novosphingobium naphthalenivorans]|uniref:hypothetical protein n=1 Tax=Novosphingobium naphthalenivorans TaxID=273168 RepID=UPI00082F8289|nr:hypothetical protein [Novosphingobium naphthalenivorans]